MPKLPRPRIPRPEPVRWYHVLGAAMPWIALAGWALWVLG